MVCLVVLWDLVMVDYVCHDNPGEGCFFVLPIPGFSKLLTCLYAVDVCKLL